MLKVKDSVAVITGGASGIGECLAKYWVENGGKVVLGDVVEEDLSRVEKEIQDQGGQVATIKIDVTKEEDNAALAKLAIDKFGAINLVAPFAGIIKDSLFINTDKETGKVKSKMTLDQFQSVLDVNLTGVFLTARECAEQMINNDCKGLIAFISSTGSLGTAGQINYGSSKAAISLMPKVITAEFFRRGIANKIRAIAVAPGYVATPMVKGMNQKALDKILENVPIQRLVEPEEVASLIKELYRNEAINGEVYFIHGGLRLGSRG